MNFFLLIIFVAFPHTKAITFTCFYGFKIWTIADTIYTCDWPYLNDMHETEELTAVFGSHPSGFSNLDVKGLYVGGRENSRLTFIPRNIETFFPNLVALYFHNNSISNLSGDELNSLGNLVLFGIQFNPALERLPGNLFSQNRNLKGVFFRESNIKFVGENLLSGLDLTHAIFVKNFCIDQEVFGSSSEIPALIEVLKTNCTDFDTTTTTTEIWTTPCGDVCSIQTQNQILIEKNSNLETKIGNLEAKIDNLMSKVEELLARH